MKDYLRKLKHKRFVSIFISELHWNTINIIVSTPPSEWDEEIMNSLINNGVLIRKYERRRRWLKF
jgi:hypothetical protein